MKTTADVDAEIVHVTKAELAVLIGAAVKKALCDTGNMPAVPRSTRGMGFSLDKRENKTRGFLYYVRYRYDGKMLPSKWNTGTNDFLQARNFAVKNRDRIITEYLSKKADDGLYNILAEYYKKDSAYLTTDKNRKRTFCEQRRRIYYNFVSKKFIPFLKQRKITRFNQIKPSHLADLQDELLSNGNKPQTVNDHLSGVKLLFDHLLRKSIIESNPFKELEPLTVREEDVKLTGCYEVDKIKRIFNKAWKDEASYLLCLLTYTTGMREIEMMNLRASDIIQIGGYRFIDIKKSKTKNGVRVVPLHDFVYAKLAAYMKAGGVKDDGLIFEKVRRDKFAKANLDLAVMLCGGKPDRKKTKAELQSRNITFKSGRHFWKTMMNAKELGDDIEEVFMGHRVTKDVAKIYNHRDKQGHEKIIRKTKIVMSILDEVIFGGGALLGHEKKIKKKREKVKKTLDTAVFL
jgi:integrase